jgi:hypothetical protein
MIERMVIRKTNSKKLITYVLNEKIPINCLSFGVIFIQKKKPSSTNEAFFLSN